MFLPSREGGGGWHRGSMGILGGGVGMCPGLNESGKFVLRRIWYVAVLHLVPNGTPPPSRNCSGASAVGTIFDPSIPAVQFCNSAQLGNDSQPMYALVNQTSKFILKPISYDAALHLVPNQSVTHSCLGPIFHLSLLCNSATSGTDSQPMCPCLKQTSTFVLKPMSYVAALYLVRNRSVTHSCL